MKYIDKYNDSINFENKLNIKIKESKNSFKANSKNIIKIKDEKDEDRISTFILFIEKLNYQNYNKNDYPIYRYFWNK